MKYLLILLALAVPAHAEQSPFSSHVACGVRPLSMPGCHQVCVCDEQDNCTWEEICSDSEPDEE